MVGIETVLGWAAIGFAASLAGMIWPFQRGPLGVALRMLVGVAGALGAAFLSFAILPPAHDHDSPLRLVFAAIGALAALFAAHLAFHRAARTAPLTKLPPAAR